MRSRATLFFAGFVLFVCCLIATMMTSRHMTEQFADAPVTLKTPLGQLCSAILKDDYELKPIAVKKPAVLKPVAPAALRPVAPTPIPTPIARPVAGQGPLANRG